MIPKVAQRLSIFLCVIIVSFLYISQVQAEISTAGFKCSTFPLENTQLAIFAITTSIDTTEEVETGVNGIPYYEVDPVGTPRLFCVEVPKNATFATWPQMITGKDGEGNIVIKREWANSEVAEEWLAKCPGLQGKWTDDGYKNPTTVEYKLEKFHKLDCNIGKFARQRYEFNDLNPDPDEMYVYFVKIANSSEHQPNPIPICAQKDGTSKSVCEAVSGCLWQVAGAKCLAKADPGINCTQLPPDVCSAANYCTTGENNTCIKKTVQVEQSKAIDKYIADRYGKPAGYDGPLPDCAFTGSCRNVEDLLQLGVNVANWLFGIIAGLGFAFFVYGGLTMVLSFGNSEKVGQGKQILVAATVGIIIAFSAYVLVSFIVKAIGINPALSPF
ncbi:MAG TPA: pilin [Candidatus Magasanikbacteria bacterium]|nr:pilin [Candidatus Magasanikbacteria bacterium]